MDMLPELVGRRARRALSNDVIDKDVIGRLLEAAVLAPSCFNNQPWRIIVVEKREGNASYAAVAESLTPGNAWALEAPVILLFTTGPHLDCRMDNGRDYAFFDAGQAALALQLQAQREGLYAHPMAGFAAGKLRAALGIPQEIVPLCVMALGKPGDPSRLAEGQRKKRRFAAEPQALGRSGI